MEYDPERCRERHSHLEQQVVTEIGAIRAMLTEVRDQVVKTNGRVSSLEKWKYGFLCAIGTLAVVKWPELVSLLGYL
jgi:hypothetical protein